MVSLMRSLPTHGLGSRALVRLRDERGIALIMAIGIMMVLTIALSTTIFFTSASARHANRSNAGQKAYALAEAGVNNAIAVLRASYDPPATPIWPGLASYLPSGQAAYNGGSCTAPVNNCTTWSGTLAGPFAGTPSAPWHYEWRISATGTVRNPTGPGAAPVTRNATAVVPVIIPTTTQVGSSGPLDFLYSGSDMWFENSVHVKAPIYVTRDLHLESTAKIDGTAAKAAIGNDLYLKNPGPGTNQNQIGLTGGTDPRIGEIHVIGQCVTGAKEDRHPCGPTTAQWDADRIFATVHDNVIPPGPPPFISFIPKLTCCAPFTGAISPAGPPAGPPDNPSNMGFWYLNADLGPMTPCTTSSGTPPTFDTAAGADSSINWSASPTTVINLTPAASYSCKSMVASTVLGELSWNATAKLLTVKGTIFIDGSITIAPGATARYTGQATIITSGTFGMKNNIICATHPGYTGPCDFSATSPWDPNKSALVIVADGLNGAGKAQGQGSDFDPGDGIHLKSSGFQGALIANHSVTTDTTTQMQGPMISVYDGVFAGQSNDLIFPPISFAPSGGDTIITPDLPKPQLLSPRNFAGG
jgi:Tfp pilus assembly protein PilX